MSSIRTLKPYNNPKSEDLFCTEVTNGTFSIALRNNMKQARSMLDRWQVVDKSKYESSMLYGGDKSLTPSTIDSNIDALDKESLLELAHLPVKVKPSLTPVAFASTAMTPNNIIDVGDTTLSEYDKFGLYLDDMYNCLVFLSKTEDNSNDGVDDSQWTLNLKNGLLSILIHTFPTGENLTHLRFINANNRNFYLNEGKLYEYNSSGSINELLTIYPNLEDNTQSPRAPLVVRDNQIYVVYKNDADDVIATNIDTGSHLYLLDENNNRIQDATITPVRASIYEKHCCYCSSLKILDFREDENGVLIGIFQDDYTELFNYASIKGRYEYYYYHINSDVYVPLEYNKSMRCYGTPKVDVPSYRTKHLGPREAYFAVDKDGYLYYTTNYRSYIKMDFRADRYATIISTREHVYIVNRNKTDVRVLVPQWRYSGAGQYIDTYISRHMTMGWSNEPNVGN